MREEYIREISSIQSGPLALECSWLTNQRNYRDLTKLWKSIMLAVVMGDDPAFQYTIHTATINPFVSCILPYILQKSVEYLSFGCSEDTLDRMICFLKAISYNEYCRDVHINDACFNLSNVVVCLLLGREDVKTRLEHMEHEQTKVEKVKTKENIGGKLNGESKAEKDPKIKAEVDDNYSKLVVNPIAIEIKRELNHCEYEPNIKFEQNFYDVDFQDENIFDTGKAKVELKDDVIDKKTVSGTKVKQEYFSRFEAEMCDDRFVDDVCDLAGCLASKWGSFEFEIIYLLSKRLEIFFHEIKSWSITVNATLLCFIAH